MAKRGRSDSSDEEGISDDDDEGTLPPPSPRGLELALGKAGDGITDAALQDKPTVLAVVAVMKARWTSASGEGRSMAQEAAARFGVSAEHEAGELTTTAIDRLYRVELLKRCRVEYAMLGLGLMDGGASSLVEGAADAGGAGYEADLARIMTAIATFHAVLKTERLAARIANPAVDGGCPDVPDPFCISTLDHSKLSDLQNFIVYLLRSLAVRGLRRYNEACYEQILSPPIDGVVHPTHAWRRVCDIREFLLEAVTKESSFKQWQNMLSGGNLDNTVRYLTGCNEVEFPELHPDRHWHAFANGLYFTGSGEFYEWGSPSIPANVVACKYHGGDPPMPFPVDAVRGAEDWTSVATPLFDGLIKYQLMEVSDVEDREMVLMWIYALLGRLLFEVGERDNWQVIPFLLGRAGTGKSLILKVVGWFFEEADVETLANNSQKGFGLETFVNKLMWRCYEVKHDFALDQAQLQSMVSGEQVSIQRKHKVAQTVTWTVPGILAGNEVASWADNSGSISRRVILISFDKKVDPHANDPHLDRKIRGLELGLLLHKCCSAYLAAVQRYGAHDIWGRLPNEDKDILPAYFFRNKKKLQQQTHPVSNWINNDNAVEVVEGETDGMPWDRFKELANLWMASNGMAKFTWTDARFKAVLEDNGIRKVKLTRAEIAAHALQVRDRDVEEGTAWVWGIKEREMGDVAI